MRGPLKQTGHLGTQTILVIINFAAVSLLSRAPDDSLSIASRFWKPVPGSLTHGDTGALILPSGLPRDPSLSAVYLVLLVAGFL